MRPPIYDHVTPKDQKVRPVVECNAKEDRTRQEFKNEADANWLLKRYGANVPLMNVQYGEQDFDLDRLQAINAVQRLETAWDSLPDHIRGQFTGWDALVAAIQQGKLTTLEAVQEAAKAAEGTSTPATGA